MATRSIGICARRKPPEAAARRRLAVSLRASSIAPSRCSGRRTKRCSAAPRVRRSFRNMARSYARRRSSSCRTTTTISTMTRRPTTSLRFRPTPSCSRSRATRQLYYPEYLPDRNRPLGLPGASAADRPPGVGEAFGTLRYGKLAEILLYDVRRTQTLAGPSAVFVDGTVETWLRSRMTDREMIHLVNIPSNPPGWSVGKWGEWYPDVLSREGKLTTDKPKPYWQSGWLKQHDRLMAEVAAMPGRIPLVISGDLHAIAEGRMQRSGALDFGKNPVVVILSGPLGTGDR